MSGHDAAVSLGSEPAGRYLPCKKSGGRSSLNFLATTASEGGVCIGLSRDNGKTSRHVDQRPRHMLSDRLARVA